ncbi:MAG: baseplate J/gp47 family protein [Oscillibacter sp.]|jgi:uncharacterized phage protein gp47/JayE|nr:baseplate J/gp47 family protein [Oscillibacter sp.]
MKTVEEIYQELLAAFAERAGWTPGDDCDLSVRLYAAAAQLQALAIQADWVLDQSFPQTASGTYLDNHAELRGLARAPAGKASGTLRFSAPSAPAADLTVEAGTICMTAAGTRFTTVQSAVLPAGKLSVEAPAAAVEAGSSGNAVAGTVTLLGAYPAGITAVTNPAAFAGGCDDEDDESLRRRILESYRRLPNGANAAWYEQTAMSHSGAATARAIGRARGIGTVDVYVATAAGQPDAALLSAIQSDLAQKREIAVDVQVKAPTLSPVNISAEISLKEGAEFAAAETAIRAALGELFTGKLLGQPVSMAGLNSLIYGIEGVSNCHLLAPAADFAGGDTILPTLGTLTVTQMEEA